MKSSSSEMRLSSNYCFAPGSLDPHPERVPYVFGWDQIASWQITIWRLVPMTSMFSAILCAMDPLKATDFSISSPKRFPETVSGLCNGNNTRLESGTPWFPFLRLQSTTEGSHLPVVHNTELPTTSRSATTQSLVPILTSKPCCCMTWGRAADAVREL